MAAPDNTQILEMHALHQTSLRVFVRGMTELGFDRQQVLRFAFEIAQDMAHAEYTLEQGCYLTGDVIISKGHLMLLAEKLLTGVLPLPDPSVSCSLCNGSLPPWSDNLADFVHDASCPHDVYALRMITPEQLAQLFHERYEALAPQFSYKTREASAVDWQDVPSNNKNLMIAVAASILKTLRKEVA